MKTITLEELLEAGCHFGHQVTRQNPKARDFIFEERDNIHIIDLVKTKEGLEQAALFVKSLAARGGSIIIVGTKRQARPIIEEEVERALNQSKLGSGQAQNENPRQEPRIFSVTNRWIGGTFTNFSEVAKNYKKLKDIVKRLADEEEKAKYTKKEVGLWEKERIKLESLYGGAADMEKIPDAIFIVDTHLEELAVLEARKMGVTTIGIVDTNADPTLIDYPIAANDDAVGSIKCITSYIVDAWIEGQKESSESKVQNSELPAKKTEEKVKPASNKETKNKTTSKSVKSKKETKKSKEDVESK